MCFVFYVLYGCIGENRGGGTRSVIGNQRKYLIPRFAPDHLFRFAEPAGAGIVRIRRIDDQSLHKRDSVPDAAVGTTAHIRQKAHRSAPEVDALSRREVYQHKITAGRLKRHHTGVHGDTRFARLGIGIGNNNILLSAELHAVHTVSTPHRLIIRLQRVAHDKFPHFAAGIEQRVAHDI